MKKKYHPITHRIRNKNISHKSTFRKKMKKKNLKKIKGQRRSRKASLDKFKKNGY